MFLLSENTLTEGVSDAAASSGSTLCPECYWVLSAPMLFPTNRFADYPRDIPAHIVIGD